MLRDVTDIRDGMLKHPNEWKCQNTLKNVLLLKFFPGKGKVHEGLCETLTKTNY